LVPFVIDHAKFASSNAIIGADKTLVDTVLQDTKILRKYTMLRQQVWSGRDSRKCRVDQGFALTSGAEAPAFVRARTRP
jgi:hypothetical protein